MSCWKNLIVRITATLDLPVPESTGRPLLIDPAGVAVVSSPSTILFIDANHQDCDYFAQRLRRSSPDSVMIQATTGQTGLAICNRQAIDCVVLELDLRDISGFEVLLKLVPRACYPEIAVIVFTRISNPYLLDATISNSARPPYIRDGLRRHSGPDHLEGGLGSIQETHGVLPFRWTETRTVQTIQNPTCDA